MDKCCEPSAGSPLETLPAGLSSLPRQIVGMPEIRQRLLERLADPANAERLQALSSWRPSGNDFGLMWLESWAYVADVLGFYDERIADESYLGTAVRRPSLRRLVQLLGYTPNPGIAAAATLAAIAEGRVAVTLPPATGFRSRGFDGEAPQVFETSTESVIHPLWNEWKVAPFRRRPTVDSSSFVGNEETGEDGNGGKGKSGSGQNRVNRLLFEPSGFGLAVDEIVVIEARNPGNSDFEAQPSRVVESQPFTGKDQKSYTRVALEPPIVIALEVDLTTLRARRPTQVAVATSNEPIGSGKGTPGPLENAVGETHVYFDQPPTLFRLSDPIVVAKDFSGEEPAYHFATVTGVEAAAVRVTSIPEQVVPGQDDKDEDIVIPSPAIPATRLSISPALPLSFLDPDTLTFHHGFVHGGDPTNTCKTVVTANELSDPEGVPIDGTVEFPLDAPNTASQAVAQTSGQEGELEQGFLVTDADEVGFLLDGRLTVGRDGHATFQALAREQIHVDQLRLPLTIYGNVVGATRGESVNGEVLGSGDARVANQRFKLKKKPLTYLHQASSGADATAQSTLRVRVDGIEWRPVGSFFGYGPSDQVYTVHHDDDQNTILTFGDGVRGSRLSPGVSNVVADYRQGAGAAAPPANHIKQLASAVKGLRSIKSPVAARPGKDADSAEALRANAPRNALLLGRAVSAADFKALALDAPGVIQASAQWLWIPSQLQAGIVVHYVGDADEASIRDTLRAQSDPTVPIEVDRAEVIAATAAVSVEIDPRFVKEAVAEAVRTHLIEGVLSPGRASIGGIFWPSAIHESVALVEGVVAVNGLSFTTDSPSLQLAAVSGTCIESGKYLDFSAEGAVTVTAVDASGLPPEPSGQGAAGE